MVNFLRFLSNIVYFWNYIIIAVIIWEKNLNCNKDKAVQKERTKLCYQNFSLFCASNEIIMSSNQRLNSVFQFCV